MNTQQAMQNSSEVSSNLWAHIVGSILHKLKSAKSEIVNNIKLKPHGNEIVVQ